MSTPPQTYEAMAPPAIAEQDGALRSATALSAGDRIWTISARDEAGLVPFVPSSIPMTRLLVRRDDAFKSLPIGSFGHKMMLGTAVLAPHANCIVSDTDARMTRDVAAGVGLVVGLSAATVLSQHIPPLMKACGLRICDDFMFGNVPQDAGGPGGSVSNVDGYITHISMASLAALAQHCGAAVCYGCGYGELAALLALARSSPVIAFESLQCRSDVARALMGDLGIGHMVDVHGDMAKFTGQYPACPVLGWCNNLRINDDETATQVPDAVLAGESFPADTSVFASVIPYNGEVDIPVCICGGCYYDFCDFLGLEGCYVVPPGTPNVSIGQGCGPKRGFKIDIGPGSDHPRVMLRMPGPAPTVSITPYPKHGLTPDGSGSYPVCQYQLFTCMQKPLTPHPDLGYAHKLITRPSDLTDWLRDQLGFVADYLSGRGVAEPVAADAGEPQSEAQAASGVDPVALYLLSQEDTGDAAGEGGNKLARTDTMYVEDAAAAAGDSDAGDTMMEMAAGDSDAGDVMIEDSMNFHGGDEMWGIDCAIAFLVKEPDEHAKVYAYRTLALVRDCGMKGIYRINQDVMQPQMRGRSFINNVNLQTAKIIRSKYPGAVGLVIEPDRDVLYHTNYEKHGFLWALDEMPLQVSTYEDVGVTKRSFLRYRKQVALDDARYPSLFFNIGDASTGARSSGKRLQELMPPPRAAKVARR